MKTVELRKASKTLADYAANLGGESIVVTSNKKPVAAWCRSKTSTESLYPSAWIRRF